MDPGMGFTLGEERCSPGSPYHQLHNFHRNRLTGSEGEKRQGGGESREDEQERREHSCCLLPGSDAYLPGMSSWELGLSASISHCSLGSCMLTSGMWRAHTVTVSQSQCLLMYLRPWAHHPIPAIPSHRPQLCPPFFSFSEPFKVCLKLSCQAPAPSLESPCC